MVHYHTGLNINFHVVRRLIPSYPERYTIVVLVNLKGTDYIFIFFFISTPLFLHRVVENYLIYLTVEFMYADRDVVCLHWGQ
jgi:hypothetical protein